MDPFHLAVGLNKCPVCGQGDLFKGWLTLNDTCSVCGARFFRDPGNWTAPTAFGYGIGAASAVLTMVVLWFVDGLVAGSEFIIIAVAVGATLATFRHVKAWWVAVLTRMGHVYPDPVESESEPSSHDGPSETVETPAPNVTPPATSPSKLSDGPSPLTLHPMDPKDVPTVETRAVVTSADMAPSEPHPRDVPTVETKAVVSAKDLHPRDVPTVETKAVVSAKDLPS